MSCKPEEFLVIFLTRVVAERFEEVYFDKGRAGGGGVKEGNFDDFLLITNHIIILTGRIQDKETSTPPPQRGFIQLITLTPPNNVSSYDIICHYDGNIEL